ncbi:MAG: lipoyl(octanoyl) transferase LipB [Betaproteobacteria bacterium]|nr:lipoyl(octanoyl) transferase LipB [Betaproteobacteria bacterium]
MQHSLIVRYLGRTEFESTCAAMQHFTTSRHHDTPDELWITEHAPVYTLGLNRKQVRPPWRDDIPVINTDRGGKITYHGPGQLIVYFLLDLSRRKLNIRSLVNILESSVIDVLNERGVKAISSKEAPGVYVSMNPMQQAKIASLGLRVKNNCCYHGLSLNVDMDLSPFKAIDPCGYAGMQVTQTKDVGIHFDMQTAGEELIKKLIEKLEYKHD